MLGIPKGSLIFSLEHSLGPRGKGSLHSQNSLFEVFKILFSQFDRMLENKSLHEREAPLLSGECASGAYFGLTSQEWSLTCQAKIKGEHCKSLVHGSFS